MPQNRTGSERAPYKISIMVIYILYIVSFVVPFTSIVGVIMAYIQCRDELGMLLYGDHLRYLIKTFWIMFVGVIISIGLFAVGIGFGFILVAVGLLFLVRSIYGLVKLLSNGPVNPASWLI